ncbi:MAG TPA: hypothetical protein VGP61_00460 [Gemmatimonadales bacterium]|jgi:hypothetical protein|nr:hypothetical protein [Gemmatimonadales bacterium]
MPASSPAPFALQSVAFGYPDNPGAIPLRDPVSLSFLGDQPEWNAAGRGVPAAFVRATRATIRVVFARASGQPIPQGVWRIGARGQSGPGIAERELAVAFDSAGQTGPLEFRLDAALPDSIGKAALEWSWWASDGNTTYTLGVTRHELLLAWKPAIAPAVWLSPKEPRDGPPDQPAANWTYLPIMQWTCEWAEGKDSPEKICDAILAGLPESGLRYAVGAWNVSAMLQKHGGYCGGWFRMFQAMAGAHGIMLERRFMAVDWRREPAEQARWCAIVVEAPGLNRKEPEENASTFHDIDERLTESSPVERHHQRRYRFWGIPGKVLDGHCINFLRWEGRWILYDASFGIRAELREFSLPASDPTHALPVEALGDFKEAYLDLAVNFMLGSLEHEGKLFLTQHPDPQDPGFQNGVTRNGLSLDTTRIPKRDALITFYWI